MNEGGDFGTDGTAGGRARVESVSSVIKCTRRQFTPATLITLETSKTE